jgi:uncharacterized integral membrane protein
MNAKLLFKTLFFIALIFLLVLIVMYNAVYVDFRLPWSAKWIKQPAPLIYFEFFAVGVLTGTIMTAGKKKSGGSGGGGAK